MIRLRIFSFVLLLASVVSYLSFYVPPLLFWPSTILTLTIPFAIIINGIWGAFLFGKRKRLSILHFSFILLAFPAIKASLNFTIWHTDSIPSFTLMNFNARHFNNPKTDGRISIDMINWVVNESSDIKCIQEFSYSTREFELDVMRKMRSKGYYSYNFISTNNFYHPGIAIFSKFPILSKGLVNPTNKSVNNMIYTDIKIKKDTIRVYSIHLQSMGLELYKYNNGENIRGTLQELVVKLKNGSIKRSKEIQTLLEHATNSPYPVIITGDFNETPYSYSYFQVRKYFRNAFEEGGTGFGFTFNHDKLPIRIDHQFYSEGLELVQFNTNREMDLSDHFPLQSTYTLPE